MPTIKFKKTTAHPPQKAFELIKNFLVDDPDLRKLDSSYQCQFNEGALTGSAKGSKFSAKMLVTEGPGGGCVELTVELPLLLSPFKGMVENVVQKKLDRVLG